MCIAYILQSLFHFNVLPFVSVECKDVKLDVYFVVDKSASIAEPEIAVERKVLKGIIAGFDIGTYTDHWVGLLFFAPSKYCTS